jgi:diaminopimelate epimerase
MKFSKMHGAGNDFLLFNGFEQELPDYSALARAVCDRHFGLGGDGIMVALPSRIDGADVRMVYYNSDGSAGEMCGNGSRCFAKFVYEKGLVQKTMLNVETDAGIKTIKLRLDRQGQVDRVTVAMGKPLFDHREVPTTLLGNPVMLEPLEAGGQLLMVTAMRMNVPHCVIVVEDLEHFDVDSLGSRIEKHSAFPEGINANFIQVMDRGHIKIKTWERGAHHTLACGTGSCAAAVAGKMLGLLDSEVQVTAEGGILQISVGPEYDVIMEGSAEFVCDGQCSPWVRSRIEADRQA